MASRKGRGSSGRRRGHGGQRGSARQRRGVEPSADRTVIELARKIASEARKSVREVNDALDAELLASLYVSLWDLRPGMLIGADPEEEIGLPVVAALERAGDARALATLRAMASVGPERMGVASEAAADRLAEAGIQEPDWRGGLGAARGLRAQMMRDVVFDDAANLIFEFERPGLDPYAIIVLVDKNLGGIAKDIIVGAEVESTLETLGRAAEADGGASELQMEEIELAEAPRAVARRCGARLTPCRRR